MDLHDLVFMSEIVKDSIIWNITPVEYIEIEWRRDEGARNDCNLVELQQKTAEDEFRREKWKTL